MMVGCSSIMSNLWRYALKYRTRIVDFHALASVDRTECTLTSLRIADGCWRHWMVFSIGRPSSLYYNAFACLMIMKEPWWTVFYPTVTWKAGISCWMSCYKQITSAVRPPSTLSDPLALTTSSSKISWWEQTLNDPAPMRLTHGPS